MVESSNPRIEGGVCGVISAARAVASGVPLARTSAMARVMRPCAAHTSAPAPLALTPNNPIKNNAR